MHFLASTDSITFRFLEFHERNQKWKLDLWKKAKTVFVYSTSLNKIWKYFMSLYINVCSVISFDFAHFASTISIWLRYLEFQSKARCKNEWNRNQVFKKLKKKINMKVTLKKKQKVSVKNRLRFTVLALLLHSSLDRSQFYKTFKTGSLLS